MSEALFHRSTSHLPREEYQRLLDIRNSYIANQHPWFREKRPLDVLDKFNSKGQPLYKRFKLGTPRKRMVKPGQYSWSRALRDGAILAARAAARYASRSSNRPSTSSAPVTSQYDARTTYRRKKLSRKGKRILKKRARFTRRVLKGLQADKEPQMVLFKDNFQISSLADGQNIGIGGGMTLYSLDGNVVGSRDVKRILDASSDSNVSVTKFYMRSAHLDLSMKNIGTDGCYVEIYYWVGRKSFATNNNQGGLGEIDTFAKLVDSGYAQQPANLTGGGTLTKLIYGTTPFQNSLITEFMKIIKKTVIHLGPGQIADVSLSSTRDFVIDGWQQVSGRLFNRRSKGIMIVQYGEPNSLSTADSGKTLASTVNYNVTRTYHFTNDRSGLVDISGQLLTS